MAARAETRKLTKYDSLAPSHTIVPVAIESLGVIGPISMAFLKDLSRRIRQRSGEVKAHQYLSCSDFRCAEGECHLSAELCG